jgi:hypothetical protein
MGAAASAFVRYPSPLTLPTTRHGVFLLLFDFAVSNQSNFVGTCLAPPRLTPGVCPIKTSVSLNARGLGENGAFADRNRSVELEGESGVNLHACQSAFIVFIGRICRRSIGAYGRYTDNGQRRLGQDRYLRGRLGFIYLHPQGGARRRSLRADSAATRQRCG